ncbi:hypothetical protein SCHPADRAFT_911633 [Schizopora paradoxa]|uniref:Uncharacterized protein n=1 Tax=Schizopora paradoxa TaxID=27342 RepID=A0A0H2QZR2_9AGAM|nr:hypothetical protein SCHPADRAFT_911633 [Schizopora paradoxa]
MLRMRLQQASVLLPSRRSRGSGSARCLCVHPFKLNISLIFLNLPTFLLLSSVVSSARLRTLDGSGRWKFSELQRTGQEIST